MKVCIIGGGPAGMMSALKVSEAGHQVTLFDRNKSLGKKLLATGNRRCNITNNKESHDLVRLIHNGRFLYSTFDQFDVESIKSFFKKYGLELVEEADNRMYPITQKSSDVLKVLETALKQANVDVKLESDLEEIIFEDNLVKSLIVNQQHIACDHLIIATGGLSFPIFGSDGSMHKLLEKHDIHSTNFYPTEAPLLSKDPLIKSLDLVGLSLQDIHLSVLNAKHKTVYQTDGDLLFTHQGLSGPAALKSAEHVFSALAKDKNIKVRLSLINTMNQQQFEDFLKTIPNDSLRKTLYALLPKRLSDYIMEKLNVDSKVTITQLSNRTLEDLYSLLFRFDISVNGVERIQRAIVTGGGIDLKQIDSKTLKHKDISNLSFCGEVLDLHGPIGGYNLTIAFLTGMMAGSSI